MKSSNHTKHTLSIITLFLILIGITSNVMAVTAKDYALYFSEDGQGVQVPDSDSLDVTGPLTIEAWVYANPGIYDAYYNFIVSKHMNGTGYVLHTFGWDKESKIIQFDNSFVLPAKQWIYIAYVWNEGVDTLYINGVLVAESFHENTPISNEFDLFIGNSPFGGELNWKGFIDEVRIWSVPRTQEEIYKDMYAKSSINQTGLVAYWDFNDGPKSTVLTDKSKNKNNGLLINSNESYNLPKWVLSTRPSLLKKPIK